MNSTSNPVSINPTQNSILMNPVPIDHLIKFIFNWFDSDIEHKMYKVNVTDFYNDFLIYLANVNHTSAISQANLTSALEIYFPDYPVKRFQDGLYIVGLEYKIKNKINSKFTFGVRLNLLDFKVYYLNTAAKVDRREHMESILSKMGFIFERFEGPQRDNRFSSGALGHAKIVYNHISSVEPFKPFIILEDDVSFKKEKVEERNLNFDVPIDCDAVYLGISSAFCHSGFPAEGGHPVKERHNKFAHLFRIYNMLSTHAILFTSLRYSIAYMLSMFEAALNRKSWDLFSCQLSTQFNVYALEDPLFYQDSTFGGQESDTKISWKDHVSRSFSQDFNPNTYYAFTCESKLLTK